MRIVKAKIKDEALARLPSLLALLSKGRGHLRYNVRPMGAVAAMKCPPMAELRDRAITIGQLRKKTAAMNLLAEKVRQDWYALPYDVRFELVHLTNEIDSQIKWPKSLLDWMSVLATPFMMGWLSLTGKHLVVEYADAIAGLIVAIKLRGEREKIEASKVWSALTNDDPAFVAQLNRSREAPGDSFKAVDWTSNPLK